MPLKRTKSVEYIQGLRVCHGVGNEVMNPPLPKEHVYPLPMTRSHVIVKVLLSGYMCTRILYPGSKDVAT